MSEMPIYVAILIFFARIADVSIGTMRTILVINGHRVIAAMLGFIETMIWVAATAGVIENLSNPLAIVAFSGGFASGIYVGMWIEDRLAMGLRVLQVVNADKSIHLSNKLREAGHRVTRIEGSGRDQPVEIAMLVIRRRKLKKVLESIRTIAPQAFISIERAERASGGAFPTQTRLGNGYLRPKYLLRK